MHRLAAAGVAVAVAATMGCHRAQPSAVTLTFWHTFTAEETEVVNDRIAAFEAAHPDIRVQSSAIPFGSAQSRVKEAFFARQAPDLFRIEASWTPEYARLGILEPADSWLSAEERADLLPDAATLFTVDGKLAAAPHVVDCLALLYDRRALAAAKREVPRNYEELLDTGAALTDARAGRYGVFVRGDGYWFLPFLWGYGGELVDAQGGVALDSKAAAAGMAAFAGVWRKGITPPGTDWGNDYRRMMRMFGDGHVAMILNGPWATPEILASPNFAGHAEALGIAPIPAGPKGAAPATPIGAHGYGITRTTAHKAEAALLARWLLDADSQVAFARRTNVLPSRRSVYERREVADNRIVQDFRTVLAGGRLRPQDPELSYVFGLLSSAAQAAVEEQLTPADAVSAVARQWRERRASNASSSDGAIKIEANR